MNIAYQIMYASSGLCLLICLFVTMGLRLSKIYEQLVQTFWLNAFYEFKDAMSTYICIYGIIATPYVQHGLNVINGTISTPSVQHDV